MRRGAALAPRLADVAKVKREATVQVLAREALDHLDELLDAIVPVLVGAEPPGFYDDESVADLRASCRVGLQGVLAYLAGAADESVLDIPRSTGRRPLSATSASTAVTAAPR